MRATAMASAVVAPRAALRLARRLLRRRLARRDRAMVAGIAPGQRPADEGRIELLQISEGVDRLGAVDCNLACLVDQIAAMRPDEPIGKTVAVADGVAEREARGLAHALERLA